MDGKAVAKRVAAIAAIGGALSGGAVALAAPASASTTGTHAGVLTNVTNVGTNSVDCFPWRNGCCQPY